MMKAISTLGQMQIKAANLRRMESELAATGEEASSLRKRDIAAEAGPRNAQLLAMRDRLGRNEGYENAISAFERRAGMMSAALVDLEKGLGDLLTVTAQNAPDPGQTVGALKPAAEAAIGRIVNAMNTSMDGRFLFSGAEIGSVALLGMDEANPVSGLTPAAAAATAAASFTPAYAAGEAVAAIAAFDAMFDGTDAGPESFEQTFYTGELPASRAAVRIDEGATKTYGHGADDIAIRNALQGAYMLASVDLVALAENNRAEYRIFVEDAMAKLNEGIEGLRLRAAELGGVQQTVTARKEALSAELVLLNESINGFEQADPIEAQIRFGEIEKQLEASYQVTVRTARLRLSNYLR